MAQETNFGLGAPGIAGFSRETFGGPDEPRYGEGVPHTTDLIVTAGADLNLPLYSVVSVINGVLALAALSLATGAATGALTLTAAGVNLETVTIGTRVYTLVTGALDAANKVKIGANATETAANLVAAINGAAGAGTTYAVGTLPHPDVAATSAAGVVTVIAEDAGNEGTVIATTETSTVASWGAATLQGGNDDSDLRPYGILAMPVVMTNGQAMSVSFYRAGHWKMQALNFHASYVTDDSKKRAFENSLSPMILISKAKFDRKDINFE